MIKSLVRRLTPEPLWRRLRAARKQWALDRGMRALGKLPEREDLPRSLAELLTYGWESGWSAQPELLSAAWTAAAKFPGPILECGSGLSTLVLGVAAARSDSRVYSLEHDPEWADRCRRALGRYGLASVVRVVDAPLSDFGSFRWYAVELAEFPEQFSLAICDGPPGDTPGGRYGLVPIMRERLTSATILLDDVGRPAEKAAAERWCREFGAAMHFEGVEKPYAVIKMGRVAGD